MKTMFKKLAVLVAIMVLAQSFVYTNVEAAARMNTTSKTIAVGKTYQLKVVGVKGKTTWKSSNNNVATVSGKGLVTGKNIGRTVISAVCNKKKYTCTIYVDSGFSEKTARNNIDTSYEKTPDGVVAILTNNNKYSVRLEATMVFYDDNRLMLDKSTDYTYCFEPGRQVALNFYAPTNSDYDTVEYASYKMTYIIRDASMNIGNADDIKFNTNIGSDNVMVEVSNSGDKKAESTTIAIVMYKNGKVIKYDDAYVEECREPGSVGYVKFDLPYDDEYNIISIDDYKLYVIQSYK